MASSSFGLFAILMMLTTGNGDLLDQISTDAYWKARAVRDLSAPKLIEEITASPAAADISELIKQLGSGNFSQREQAAQKIQAMGPGAVPALEKATNDPDPEVANRVRNLIRQVNVASKATRVRKLMAIRTLGEMKKAEAVPALKSLLDSREMFVADYARRALARIEGKDTPARDQTQAMAGDLALLPGNCAIVAQMRSGTAQATTLDKILGMLPPGVGPQNREEVLQQVIEQVIGLAEQVGNLRFDGVTLGVSDDVGDQNGFVVVIARGQYDPQAVEAFLGKVEQLKSEAVNGARIWSTTGNGGPSILFPSGERALLMAGPSPDKLPTRGMLAALQAGRFEKGLSTNQGMTKLMGRIDTTAPIWGAMLVSEPLKKAGPVISAFEFMTLVAKQDKTGTSFEINAAGDDAQKVAAAVAEVNKVLDEARKHVPVMAQAMPAFKPMADLILSVKCEAQDKSAKLTARTEGEPGAMMLVPAMLFTGRAQAVPAAPVEAPEKIQEQRK